MNLELNLLFIYSFSKSCFSSSDYIAVIGAVRLSELCSD